MVIVTQLGWLWLIFIQAVMKTKRNKVSLALCRYICWSFYPSTGCHHSLHWHWHWHFLLFDINIVIGILKITHNNLLPKMCMELLFRGESKALSDWVFTSVSESWWLIKLKSNQESLCESGITWISKPYEDITRKKMTDPCLLRI